jgi:hypothetical protein
MGRLGFREGECMVGALLFADVTAIGALPDFEIAEVKCAQELPDSLTYP